MLYYWLTKTSIDRLIFHILLLVLTIKIKYVLINQIIKIINRIIKMLQI
jgi:hypothetical protein